MIPRLVITLLLAGPLDAAEPFVLRQGAAVLQSAAIAEASGIAASRVHRDLLWIINDSGCSAELHRTNSNGSDLGKVLVSGIKNNDWEDLSSFLHGGKPYLLIADTGDNSSKRPACQLHVVAEPQPDATQTPVAWTIDFTYEDGPRDCEAVAVDEKAGKILLLSKRTVPPVLYELPLKPNGKQPVVAKRIAAIKDPLATGTLLPLPYGTQPTGLDLGTDGKTAAVVTYARVFVFSRSEGEPWDKVFSRPPVTLEPHLLRQAESVCLSQDGGKIFVISEGIKSPVTLYQRGKE